MALSQRLQIRQAQSLVMTPQLQQAIKLLQMSNVDLAAYVEQQIVENPLLDLLEADGSNSDSDRDKVDWGRPDSLSVHGGGAEADTSIDGQLRERDSVDVVGGGEGFGRQLEAADTDYGNVWDDGGAGDGGVDSFRDGLLWGSQSSVGARDWDSSSNWEAFAESPISLRAHLEAQIGEEFPDPIIRRVATLLADQLDEAGYFTGEFAEIAYLLGVSQDTVAAVHKSFLQFDPPGIGALTLSECLAIQLAATGALDDSMQCLLDHLELVGKGDFQRLARICGTDLSGVSDMLERLKRCVPRPAAAFDHSPVQTVIPDVIVRRGPEGCWHVELNQDALPQVLANRSYYASVRRRTRGKEEAEFVTEQWQTANWLVKALDQRANTILKTTAAIVERQDRFFEEGVTGLRPMTLKDVAEAIDMHESTVSRVTNGKYVATPRGLLELKFFFTNAITSDVGDDGMSAEAVRHRLRRLIETETAENVLSDERLVEMLGADGITVARRTVAKYRESMNIPPSSRRRRLLKLAAG